MCHKHTQNRNWTAATAAYRQRQQQQQIQQMAYKKWVLVGTKREQEKRVTDRRTMTCTQSNFNFVLAGTNPLWLAHTQKNEFLFIYLPQKLIRCRRCGNQFFQFFFSLHLSPFHPYRSLSVRRLQSTIVFLSLSLLMSLNRYEYSIWIDRWKTQRENRIYIVNSLRRVKNWVQVNIYIYCYVSMRFVSTWILYSLSFSIAGSLCFWWEIRFESSCVCVLNVIFSVISSPSCDRFLKKVYWFWFDSCRNIITIAHTE